VIAQRKVFADPDGKIVGARVAGGNLLVLMLTWSKPMAVQEQSAHAMVWFELLLLWRSSRLQF
jgi:hypothetical protein